MVGIGGIPTARDEGAEALALSADTRVPEPKTLNRREFLKGLALMPGGLGLAPTLAPWSFWTRASAYGPGLYLPGNMTADGTPFEQDSGPRLVSIAHRTLPLGVTVAIEIPPQPGAWGSGLALNGALIWCRVNDRGPYTADAGRDVDLTMGLLREAGWFDRSITAEFGERSEYAEAYRWGVRWVRVHVFG